MSINGNGKVIGPEIHVPIPARVREKMREGVLRQLLKLILAKAEKEKAKANGVEGRMELTEQEVREISEKTRAELEKKGWFRAGAAVR